MPKLRLPVATGVALAAGIIIGLAGTAGAQPAATTSLPAYCTSHVTTVRTYSANIDPGDDSFRMGAAGHGGKLDCITVDMGNYQKTEEFNPATGGWLIPITGIKALYVNCCGPGDPCSPAWPTPGYRWSPSGLPYNDCAEEYAQSTTTPDGGLKIAWPDYNGTPMFPPSTP